MEAGAPHVKAAGSSLEPQAVRPVPVAGIAVLAVRDPVAALAGPVLVERLQRD